jgi:dUTP pyrophosphatase
VSGATTLQVDLLRPSAKLPQKQSALASGFDLHACLDGGTIELGTAPQRVPTGIAVAVPTGYDVQIRPRSGLAARGVLSTLGTLDADYRGELFVTMYCLSEPGHYLVEDGERIAQLVVAAIAAVEFQVVEKLDETVRGSGGHGSTGRH